MYTKKYMSLFNFRKAKMADTKNLKDEYDKGATIDALAEKYDMTPAEVEAEVVVPAKEDAPVLQADQTEPAVETKKAK